MSAHSYIYRLRLAILISVVSTFSWTPRHMSSLAAAYGTDYELSVVELYDRQAVARDGMQQEMTVFKNSRYSEVFYFDYAADCPPVQMLGAIIEKRRVNITWTDVGALEYTVEYRKKGSSRWYTAGDVKPGQACLYNLQFGREYEYRVGCRCVPNDVLTYSAVKSFKMPDREEKSPQCGIMPESKITNRTPVDVLVPGQPFMAGDFTVFVTKVSGSGTFTGEGYVGIPYLNNAQVAVTFNNISVNTDLQLISGYVETKFDPVNTNLVMNVDKTLTGGQGVGDIRSGEERAAFEVTYVLNPNIKVKPLVTDSSKDDIKEGGNNTFVKGENGKYRLVFTDGEGNEHIQETDSFPFTVQDGNGNTFEVNETGDVKAINIQRDMDEVIVAGLSDNYEVVINGETEKATTDKKLKLVYENQMLKMQLRKSNGDSIKTGNIQWQITENKKTGISDSILTKEITMNDKEITIVIYEKVPAEKGKEKKAKIVEFTFVPRQSPYVTLSTPNGYDGEFGFDDEDGLGSIKLKVRLEDLYDTIHVADEKNKTKVLSVPWMTLEQGQSASLNVKLSEIIDGDNIYIKLSDNSITASYDKVQNRLHVANNGLNNEFNNPAYISFYRDDKYGLQKNMLIGRCAIVSRPAFESIAVQIVYFSSDTSSIKNTIDATRLQMLLNSKSMNQAFVKFNVLPDIIHIKDNLSAEKKANSDRAYRSILPICSSKGMSLTDNQHPATVYVMLTDLVYPADESGSKYKGGGVLGKSNLAIMWLVKNLSEDKEKAIVHEIGHTLGLNDVFKDLKLGGYESNESPGYSQTKSNYMDYFIQRRMFFKSQIETIIENLKKGEK